MRRYAPITVYTRCKLREAHCAGCTYVTYVSVTYTVARRQSQLNGNTRPRAMGAVLSTTGTNCCFSSVLLGYACSVGGIHKLQNRFAFPAPQPTYAITNGSELSFNEPQLADEAAQVRV